MSYGLVSKVIAAIVLTFALCRIKVIIDRVKSSSRHKSIDIGVRSELMHVHVVLFVSDIIFELLYLFCSNASDAEQYPEKQFKLFKA